VPRALAPRCERYSGSVGELLEVAGSFALAGVVLVAVGYLAYLAFGPQAIGLPVMMSLLVIWGAVSAASNAGVTGPVGILEVVGGVVAMLLVIGMAMRLGSEPSTRSDAERRGDDS
jgi:hypothetical protein